MILFLYALVLGDNQRSVLACRAFVVVETIFEGLSTKVTVTVRGVRQWGDRADTYKSTTRM